MDNTFWMDFSIADKFGEDAIQDTFNRAFKEWKTDYRYLTELVLVLNHKIWEWYEAWERSQETNQRCDSLARLYDKLWREADAYAYENLKGDELSYYYRATD